MFSKFKKDEIDALIEKDTEDRERLDRLETQREDLLPRFTDLQMQAEIVAARLQGIHNTQPGPSDVETGLLQMWEAREKALRIELEDLIRQRDATLREVNKHTLEAREGIANRRTILIESFRSWLWKIAEAYSEDATFADGLMKERETIEQILKTEPLRTVIDRIAETVERVEERPDFDGPVYKLSEVVKRAKAAA